MEMYFNVGFLVGGAYSEGFSFSTFNIRRDRFFGMQDAEAMLGGLILHGASGGNFVVERNLLYSCHADSSHMNSEKKLLKMVLVRIVQVRHIYVYISTIIQIIHVCPVFL